MRLDCQHYLLDGGEGTDNGAVIIRKLRGWGLEKTQSARSEASERASVSSPLSPLSDAYAETAVSNCCSGRTATLPLAASEERLAQQRSVSTVLVLAAGAATATSFPPRRLSVDHYTLTRSPPDTAEYVRVHL